MNQYDESFNSTLSTHVFQTNQSLNEGLSSTSASISKSTVMRYTQVVYVATLVILGVSGNILCAIVFCTKSLR